MSVKYWLPNSTITFTECEGASQAHAKRVMDRLFDDYPDLTVWTEPTNN
jgi:hypothetical protein